MMGIQFSTAGLNEALRDNIIKRKDRFISLFAFGSFIYHLLHQYSLHQFATNCK